MPSSNGAVLRLALPSKGALEKSAMALRSIASSGRGLRRGTDFERSLAPVVTLLLQALPDLKPDPKYFQPVDALRIIEILCGSPFAEKHARAKLRVPGSGI